MDSRLGIIIVIPVALFEARYAAGIILSTCMDRSVLTPALDIGAVLWPLCYKTQECKGEQSALPMVTQPLCGFLLLIPVTCAISDVNVIRFVMAVQEIIFRVIRKEGDHFRNNSIGPGDMGFIKESRC